MWAHNDPVFRKLKLQQIKDLYRLKVLKFYYSLYYGLFPSCFNCYIDVLNENMPSRYEFQPSARPKFDCLEDEHIYRIMFSISDNETCKLHTYK